SFPFPRLQFSLQKRASPSSEALSRRQIGMGAQPFRRISLRSPGRPVSGRKRDFFGGTPSGGSPGVSFWDPSPSPRCANFTGAYALSAYPYSTIPHQRLPASVWQIRARYFHCRGKIPGSIPLRTPALIGLILLCVDGAG